MTVNKIKYYTKNNYKDIPQIQEKLSPKEINDIYTIGTVLPFKVNNYVTDELIDWNNIPNDPVYQLTFPQHGMLSEDHFNKMETTLASTNDNKKIKKVANEIRLELNPNPAGQAKNIPVLDGTKLTGVQHKYNETVLFFPKHSQTCHAYCTFCFRWPQFVGIDEIKFGMKESELLVKYIQRHPEINNILFTGGDPMIMSANNLQSYIDPILEANIEHLKSIRIGTKSLTYWPYRYLTDKDSDDVLRLFEKIVNKGYHLAIMAHFNHPNEMKTEAVKKAIQRIRNTGAIIRTQSPIMNHINNNSEIWIEMWEKQVNLGCIPYYMFVARDTGARDYFAVTLADAHKIYRNAYMNISGLARTVRGPSMSANPGKVQILGVNTINGEKLFSLRFIQGRNKEWVGQPFFAKYDEKAVWLDELKPAFDQEKFIFE